MTGSINFAQDLESLQKYPFTQFAAYAMPFDRNEAGWGYKVGSSQRFQKLNVGKRRWRAAHRLTATELQTMRDFYKAHLVEPFNFVDPINNMACKAVFTGTFQEAWNPTHFSVSVELAEVV